MRTLSCSQNVNMSQCVVNKGPIISLIHVQDTLIHDLEPGIETHPISQKVCNNFNANLNFKRSMFFFFTIWIYCTWSHRGKSIF